MGTRKKITNVISVQCVSNAQSDNSFQNALPTQGLSSSHLLSLDALLAIVRNFHASQTAGQQTTTLLPQSLSTRAAVGETRRLAVSRGSTQINSAGIIFSSRAGVEKGLTEEEEEGVASSLTISTVRSESALFARVGANRGGLEDAYETEELDLTKDDSVTKAASGYMMGTRSSDDGILAASVPTVDLPTPKELIEIRQRKKVSPDHLCMMLCT